MNPAVFKLEEYLARYEFQAPYLLCSSDAESFSMQEILELASPSERDLWKDLRLGYTEAPGLPLLRDVIAKNLYRPLSSSHILTFAGAEDGIFCALHTLCDPGDHVITFSPCYQSLVEIPKIKGAHVSVIPLKESHQWRLDREELRKTITPQTKGIIINFPHNPTGQVLTTEELGELISVCEKHDLWLFSDEVYRLLGNPQKDWAAPAAVLYKKALSLGVMSKAFGMAGLRVGWIACQDTALLKKIEQRKHYTSICNSAPSEILSVIALENKGFILARNNEIVKENLRLLEGFMQEYHTFFEWVRPQGGCVGFVHYKGSEPIDSFSNRLVEEKGVLLLPASVYDVESNHFRIGFGRKNMPEALKRLKEFLED